MGRRGPAGCCWLAGRVLINDSPLCRMSKRRRVELDEPTTVTVFRAAKRPVDKELIFVALGGIDTVQAQTILYTATFPATIVGLRWDLSMFQDAGTSAVAISWAIVIVREGLQADNLNFSDGSTIYNPEQNLLVFGTTVIQNQLETKHITGSTKTMRKFMGGDQLMFIARGEDLINKMGVRAMIQFFAKT